MAILSSESSGLDYYDFFAEREGFEPPVPCGTPDFKSGTIDQLCHLSYLLTHILSNTKYQTPFKIGSTIASVIADVKSEPVKYITQPAAMRKCPNV